MKKLFLWIVLGLVGSAGLASLVGQHPAFAKTALIDDSFFIDSNREPLEKDLD